MIKIKIVESNTKPKCPYCEKELDCIEVIDKGFFEQTMIYTCPFCKKILSIGYNWL